MCYACTPALPALKMVPGPARPEPTGPQYFTFDPLPEAGESPAPRNLSKSNRIKKRSRRVLYPRVVSERTHAQQGSSDSWVHLEGGGGFPEGQRSGTPLNSAILCTFTQEVSPLSSVKRYYPAEERSYVKHLFVILLTIIFFQVYSAEEEFTVVDASQSAEKTSQSAAESAIDITQFLEQRPAAF
uniref:Radiation-inducible immediate-early gene IEX-1 n=1 Tax=Podarcis muralis TaxID=64176 RepID=A0A670HL28_PODMU